MSIIWIGIALAAGAVSYFSKPEQEDPKQTALQTVFDDLEKGIKGANADTFKARWHAEGFEKNLCGGSGLAGKEVYAQGSRKKWFLKPDLANARFVEEGAVAVVACSIFAWEKDKAVDKVQMVLVKTKDAYIVLGGGEKAADVDGLVSRWIKKEPLEAPKKSE